MNRRILFIITAGILCAGGAHASVTKVGNGDDGADLENLKMIKEGPIVESRALAAARVRALNAAGVPGLGMLIPEIERTDLMMADKDVHPTGEADGALEISADRGVVYARTFAEPYAVTRFFPAATKLTTEQLIALHIHEALHRALPENIRENEDIVMHLSMALTSPGSSFDRVRQVGRLYVKTEYTPAVAGVSAPQVNSVSSRLDTAPARELPASSPSKVAYTFDSYFWGGSVAYKRQGTYSSSWHGLEFATNLGGYKHVGPYDIEPNFRARMKIAGDMQTASATVGQSAFDLSGKTVSEYGSITAPYVRFTAKALDQVDWQPVNRDIWTIGFTHQKNFRMARAYFNSDVFYSLPSESRTRNQNVKYNSILSMAGHGGWAHRKWRLGGLAELHASSGSRGLYRGVQYEDGYSGSYESTNKTEAFRLLVLGPEVGYMGDRFQAKLFFKTIVNGEFEDLGSLGDQMDRGTGSGGFGFSLAALF